MYFIGRPVLITATTVGDTVGVFLIQVENQAGLIVGQLAMPYVVNQAGLIVCQSEEQCQLLVKK